MSRKTSLVYQILTIIFSTTFVIFATHNRDFPTFKNFFYAYFKQLHGFEDDFGNKQLFVICGISCLFYTTQKMKFSIKDFFSKCDQIRRKLRIWSSLLKKSLMESVIFCAVLVAEVAEIFRFNIQLLCKDTVIPKVNLKICTSNILL